MERQFAKHRSTSERMRPCMYQRTSWIGTAIHHFQRILCTCGSEYDDDSDENITDDDGSNEDQGVGHQEENRRSSRNRQEPERFTESEYSPTFAQVSLSFFQAFTQYQNIDAIMSTKRYGTKAGLKFFGDAGLDAVTSKIRNNLHRKSSNRACETIISDS